MNRPCRAGVLSYSSVMPQADESTVDSSDVVEAPQRSVRISRVAFQDMHHLVLRRLSARAQIRRHAQKLTAWQPDARSVCDLEIEDIEATGLYAAIVTDDLGCGPGYRIVFCDHPAAPANDTLCIIALLRLDEQVTSSMKIILQGRATIARHRLVLWAR